MTKEEFVKRLKLIVHDSAINSCILTLEQPPGRRPHKSLVTLSAWYNQLSLEDQERVRETAALAARSAVFGMLAVLDGVRAFSDPEENASLELWYKSPGESVLLNEMAGDFLHDIFVGEVPLK